MTEGTRAVVGQSDASTEDPLWLELRSRRQLQIGNGRLETYVLALGKSRVRARFQFGGTISATSGGETA
jgi:hypothetical protein